MEIKELIKAFNELDEDEQLEFTNMLSNQTVLSVLDGRNFEDDERYEIARNLDIDLKFLLCAETMQQGANLETLAENFERINQTEFEYFLDRYKI